MAENQKLGNSGAMGLSCELDEMDTQKISVSDQTNSLQLSNFKSDSITVDMDRLSHLTEKDKTANSRITLQRKGSQQRGGEKKINNSSFSSERDTDIPSTASPRAASAGSRTPEKPMVVTVGTTAADQQTNNPQVHHQITIMTGNIGGTTTTAESRSPAKRFSFRRSSSSSSWAIGPRRILFFFATLSSMGTILLIYFTLSIGKLSGDDNALNW